MIRHLTEDEIPLTKECAFGFFKESGLPGELQFDYWIGRWQSIISELDIGTILVYESDGRVQGTLGGLCVRCSMTGQLEAIEAFWYIMPEARGSVGGIKLLKSFEQWARERGAVRVKMMHLSDLNASRVRDMYLRMGYSPLESAYSKEL